MTEATVSLEWCLSRRSGYGGRAFVVKRFMVRGEGVDRAWLHFRSAEHDVWSDAELARSTSLPDGSKLFELAAEQGRLPDNMQFAVRARTAAGDIWDNNGGHDFRLGLNDGPLVRVPLVLGRLGYARGRVFGTAYVQNLNPRKQVRVYYSLDHCRSFHRTDAAFVRMLRVGPDNVLPMPNVHGCEAWDFSIPVDSAALGRQAVLYLEYAYEGKTHYDLNHHRLYHVAPAPQV